MRFFYSFLFYLALPFLFLRLLWRSRRGPAYRERWLERFGFYGFQLKKSIWVHSVSVGETLAAVPLIKALLEKYPHNSVVVTTMTPTGAARVRAAFGDKVKHVYIPYDFPCAVSRFLKHVQPQVAVIMETELWPNLLAYCKKYNVPVVLANARLSAKSQAGYQRIGSLTKQMLQSIHALAAQADADAMRFVELGMPKERVTITGNIKFDMPLPDNLLIRSAELRNQLGKDRLVWIAASTHEGEEAIALAAHQEILKVFPGALLILVPRHPERFAGVAELAQQQGFATVRRSQSGVCTPETTVYLGDTMGEMLLMYAAADVAFVGGSLVGVGGHNLLEPAMLSKPVISGPILFNFAAISEMLREAHALTIIEDAPSLAKAIQNFFKTPALREEVGLKGYKVVEANRGALGKQLELIYPLVDK